MRGCEYMKPFFFVLCCIFIFTSYVYFDQPVAYFFQALDLTSTLPFVSWSTHVGSGPFDLALFIALAGFFHLIYKSPFLKERCLFLVCCVFFPNFICLFLKILLGRARPELLFLDHSYGFYGVHLSQPMYWSFPSGHTTTIVATLFGMHRILPGYIFFWAVLGVMFISTRVLLNQHYLSDVVATTCLTLLELFVIMHIMQLKGWFQFKAYQKAA